jgi:hypothetical protein
MRLRDPRGGASFAVGITKRGPLAVSAGAGEGRQHVRPYARSREVERSHRLVQRIHATAQSRRQHLLELRERAQGRFLDARHRSRRCRPEAERHRERLVVLEQERRQ